jgi:hypothetical protein
MADVETGLRRAIDVGLKAAAEIEAAAAAAAVLRKAAAVEAGDCVVCLNNDGPPFPTQGGCACRDTAGLAHLACRIQAATHSQAVWWQCGTCQQAFTGMAQLGLARARLQQSNDLVAGATTVEVANRCHDLASAFIDHHMHAKAAETMSKEVLVVRKQVLGEEHPSTLIASSNLAGALFNQGKHAEAEPIFREVLVVQKRVLGEEHPSTLHTASKLASTLCNQGKFTEAETMFKEVLVVQKRVLGEEHPNTLHTVRNQTQNRVQGLSVTLLEVCIVAMIGYLPGFHTVALLCLWIIVGWPAIAKHLVCAVAAIYLVSDCHVLK